MYLSQDLFLEKDLFILLLTMLNLKIDTANERDQLSQFIKKKQPQKFQSTCLLTVKTNQ